MSKKLQGALALAAAGLVAACGGGGGSTPAQEFAQNFSASVQAMASPGGLTSAALLDLFAGTYLDAGMTKDQLTAALRADAAALASTPEFSLFPLAFLTDVTLTNCDAQNVCTLNGTLTNSDADTTSVPFSAKVQVANNTVRLLGDQSAS